MASKFVAGRYLYVVAGLCLFGVLSFIFRDPIWQFVHNTSVFLTDRGRIEAFIASFGRAAPFIFMGVQILQVILAPIPGEATGFIGGYLFGWLFGFIYSSLALAIGSWINFSIGRVLGERYVRRMISPQRFARFDRLVRRQGIIVIFLLFIFPGFPKDWLSLFLGITTLPVKVFLVMATIGRMPGTLLLSLQGELLIERNYPLLAVLFVVSLLLAGGAYLVKDKLYSWIEKSNHP